MAQQTTCYDHDALRGLLALSIIANAIAWLAPHIAPIQKPWPIWVRPEDDEDDEPDLGPPLDCLRVIEVARDWVSGR